MRLKVAIALAVAFSFAVHAQTKIDHSCTLTGRSACVPPVGVFRLSDGGIVAGVPFDAPVKYGGIVGQQWQMLKAGEPSRACTAAEDAVYVKHKHYNPCRAKIGEPLYTMLPFMLFTPRVR